MTLDPDPRSARPPRVTARARRLGAAALLVPLACNAAPSRDDADDAIEDVVVTAARVPTLVRDQPLRVEAVPAEEIEENLTARPGDVTALLAELPGVQFQASAPALGGAALQLRGLAGRQTRVLLDGLPLLGAETGAFGLLQVPPLDLARVEVVKGPVSALYGAGGLGGLLNLVAARPGAESAFLAGATSRGARDAVGFLASPADASWRATLTGGVHGQTRQDVDRDGWADLPAYRRYTLRPRAWFGGDGHETFVTAGASAETREGGTMPGRVLPASGAPFPEAVRTERIDAGATTTRTDDRGRTTAGRYAIARTHSLRTFGPSRAGTTSTGALIERTLAGTAGAHRWLAGAALEWDALEAGGLPGLGHSWVTPGAFLQDTWTPRPWLIAAANLRVDAHERYGTFASPRVSLLLRPGDAWSVRLSGGTGFAVPTTFVDAVESTWVGALLPPRGLRAERARSVSLDARWTDGGLELAASAFVNDVRDALDAREAPGRRLELYNRPGRWRAPGAELLAGYVAGPLHLLASWSALRASAVDATGRRRDADRVPRSTATVGAILEDERRGRVGLEAEYTGTQAIDDDPYRRRAPGFTVVNALAEWKFGDVAIYVNALNLTDVRQTRRDPLLRPDPGPGGDPVTSGWAPLDGRTFGIGIRGEL